MIFAVSLISLCIDDILYTCNGDHLGMGHAWDQSGNLLTVSMYDMLNIFSL